MPQFAPLRVRAGRFRLRRAARHRRRAAAAGLAMTAAALAASGLREAGADAGPETRRVVDPVAVRAAPPGSTAAPVRAPGPGQRASPDVVAVPVRIADGATVRLLRPGDRVDVLAVPLTPAGTAAEGGGAEARVVAAGVRVRNVPGAGPVPALEGEGNPPDALDGWGDAGQSGGALLVLAVPRPAAADLVAAAASSRLAVVLC